MSLLDKLREKLSPKQDDDPWNKEANPLVSEEEMQEAIEKMKQPRPPFPWWRVESGLLILWMVVHFAILYVMIGSPLNGGIFVYVLFNLYIFTRYLLILGRVNRK